VNGGLTFIVDRAALGGPDQQPPLAVTVPAGAQAAAAVQREGRILQGLSGLALGELRHTVPQHVETMSVDDRPVLVATALPGRPMSAARSAPSTPRHQRMRRDFDLAGAWLAEFWAATTDGSGPVTWGADVADAVRGRWDGHPHLKGAVARLETAERHLRRCVEPRTAVHGEFCADNVLVEDARVSGVVGWRAGALSGSPLRDLARFAMSYRVRRTRGAAAFVRPGRLACTIRDFLVDGLAALGMPTARWYHVAVTGIGELAGSAPDDAVGLGHLELLAGLPATAPATRDRGARTDSQP
jgi:aminoglycoside phosphotransferase (APT) family kinase protein